MNIDVKIYLPKKPSRKVDEEYRDVCYPSTKEFRQEFDQAVLDAYAEAVAAQPHEE